MKTSTSPHPLPALDYDHGGLEVTELAGSFGDAQWYATAIPYHADPQRERVVRQWESTQPAPFAERVGL